MNKKMAQLIGIILIFIVVVFTQCVAGLNAVFAATTTIEPESNQYFELKLVSIEDIEGKDKQIIMELWANNLQFKGADVRFEYDMTKLKPSSIVTNDYAYNSSMFEFVDEFSVYMSNMILNDGENVVRMTMSVEKDNLPLPVSYTNPHVEQLDNGTYQVNSNGSVMIGRMSFRLFNGDVSDGTFILKQSTTKSPKTGIKINVDGINAYENQSTFRFTLKSSNANLTDIKKWFFNDSATETENLENIDSFNKETYEYTLNLNEYKDFIRLKPIPEDDKATIKVKVPKRDSITGELVYDDSGGEKVLQYEEKELTTQGIIDVKLNELGKEDTVLEIKVIAENGINNNTYKVKIHRPFGTIKGKIQLGDGLAESMEASYGYKMKFIADIKLYTPGSFDWSGILPQTSSLSDLDLIDPKASTKSKHKENDSDTFEEGEFILYTIPGQYDCFIERLGFIAQVVVNVTVNEGDVIDLGTKILIEGDTNRDGMVSLEDLINIITYSGASKGDPTYVEYYDFGQKDFIGLPDVISVADNLHKEFKIQNY